MFPTQKINMSNFNVITQIWHLRLTNPVNLRSANIFPAPSAATYGIVLMKTDANVLTTEVLVAVNANTYSLSQLITALYIANGNQDAISGSRYITSMGSSTGLYTYLPHQAIPLYYVTNYPLSEGWGQYQKV